MRFHLNKLIVYLMILCIVLVLQYWHYMITKKYNEKRNFNVIRNIMKKIHVLANTKHSQIKVLYFERDEFNVSKQINQQPKHKKTVMLYNIPAFLDNLTCRNKLYKNCDYQNCIFTRDKKKLLTAHAVIFYVGIRNERMGINPPITQTSRNPNQVWIFTATESPEHYYNTDYLLPSWYNTMNWSSLYRLDSDIPIPYGALVRQNRADRPDYISVYKSKTKTALWYVSHCQVASERRLYVNEMIKHGFDVDILGGCGADGKRTKTNKTEFERTIPNYKFYLAFENTFCNDYVTEKFFRNYNLNWILIVRGGADYQKLFPTDTYINTNDFKDIPSLVYYLLRLGNDREKYIEILHNKDRYKSITKPFNRNCEICRRLNNLSNFKNKYGAIGDYLNTGQCRRPADI